MHTYIDPNLRRKLGKRRPTGPLPLKTPGELLLRSAEEANEAARLPQSEEPPPHQGPKA